MIRKVVTRSPHREVGIVNAGWLLEHPVEHESHLEKRFVMVALSCPVVIDIKHQPIEVMLGDAHDQKYTPDFEVAYHDGQTAIVEVKPEVFLEEAKPKLDQARAYFSALGRRYLVITDKQVDANGLSARALLLMRYGRLGLDEAAALECKQLLDNRFNGSAHVRDLMNRGVSEALVWSMVARHQLQMPAGLNVNPNEKVTTNNSTGDCHDFFLEWLGITQG